MMCHAELANPFRARVHPFLVCQAAKKIVGKRIEATIMASRGRPSFALATGSYVTVDYRCILAKYPSENFPLDPKPPLPCT